MVIYGNELGKKFNLDAVSLVVGRSSKSDIQIDQESVSRNHSRVSKSGAAFVVEDLNSTNGTYVNDEAVSGARELRDGDFLKIGRTIFKFLSGGNIERAYHEEIYTLTTMDGLTQVYNKRYFVESLDRELARAQRYRRDLSLVMLDVDHFKKINDTFGHLAGDMVLKDLAATIAGRIRREDVLARYGGEEFSIILPEIDGYNAHQFAEKIRAIVEQSHFMFESTVIPVTISMGVSTSGEDTPDAMGLVRAADEKLYEAKRTGRNRVVS